MGRTFQSGIISRLVVGGGTYAVLHNETQIDVDNSNGLPTIIKLQPIDPSLGQCTVYINDYGNNSSVGNITIVASGGNLINGQPTLVLDTDGIGAEISVSDQRNFIASLNNDTQSTGGLTTADNGLTVFGTNVQLGGNLLLPTTIDALGVNTLSINDVSGLFLQTRDALGNFFMNNISGNGTLVGSSQYIYSYLGDGGNIFTDTSIVVNFGGTSTISNGSDFWNFGDYTQSESSFNVRNFGRKNYYFFGIDGNVFGSYNTVDTLSSFSVIGDYNILSNGVNISIFGNGNNYSSINDKVILGNNNNNLIIDGVTGIISSEATYNNTSFAHLNNIVGVDMNGDFYNTGLNASAVLTGAGLPNYVSKWTSGSDLTVSQLFDNGVNVGINTITPSAKLHLKGIDATSSNYTLKVDNSAFLPLLYVRNDGKVGIGTSTPSALLDIVAVDNVPYALSVRNNTHTTNPLYGQKIYQENNGRVMYYIDSQHYMHVSVGGSVCYTTDGYVSPDTQLITQAFAVGSASYALYAKGISNNGLTVDGDGNVGINQFTATAKLHIKGIDSTSSNYALKVDNSAFVSLLSVRNDGLIGLGINSFFTNANTLARTYTLPDVSTILVGRSVLGVSGQIPYYTNANELTNDSGFTIGANQLLFSRATATATQLNITNTTNSTSSTSGIFMVVSGSANNSIRTYSATYTTSGLLQANLINYNSNTSVGVLHSITGGFHKWAIGGSAVTNEIMRLTTGGLYVSTLGTLSNATATIHAKGIDATSGNFSLKVDNSAFTHLLYVKNDGEIEMNGFTIRQLSNYTIFKTSGTNGYLFNNSSDSTNLARLTDSGVLILNQTASQNPNVQLSVQSNSTGNLIKESIAELFKKTTNNTGILVSAKEGVSYIQGTTSANGQKVDLIMGGYDGAGNQLESLFLKNNGVIAMPTLQVGNVGLVSGDLYVDTSANILANGDLVVGRKV